MKVNISIFMVIIVLFFSPLHVMAKSVLDSKMSTEKKIIDNQVNINGVRPFINGVRP